MNDWIKASEKLPEEGQRVLVITQTKKRTQNYVLGYQIDGIWVVGMNSNVTHWMPLPEPPEVEPC